MSSLKYDIGRARQQLLDIREYDLYMTPTVEQLTRDGYLMGYGLSSLSAAITCMIVGMAEEGQRLAERAAELYTVAFREGEVFKNDYEQYATEAVEFRNLALAKWLATSSHDAEHLLLSTENEDIYLRSSGRDRSHVGAMMPTYVDAKRYERALELYGQYCGAVDDIGLRSAKSEAKMSVILSRHYAYGDWSDEEIDAGVDRFLRSGVREWLPRGFTTMVARWMKICIWNRHPGLSSYDVLSKVSSYL